MIIVDGYLFFNATLAQNYYLFELAWPFEIMLESKKTSPLFQPIRPCFHSF